jgi:hypothetical protein
MYFFKGGIYSTLLHLPLLGFHCVGGCCCWDYLAILSNAVATRLDFILKRLEIKPETIMSRPGTEPGVSAVEASRVLELVSQISS